jgi:hypothetical protein
LAAALTDETGSGAAVFATSPALTTPNLGTPSAATLTNATGLPLSTGVTGQLPLANGGTAASLSDPNDDRILFWDDSAGTVTWLDIGSGLSLTGTTLSTTDAGGTVTSVGGTGTVNGLTLSGTVTSSGNLTLGGTLAISNADWSGADLSLANGGTGASLSDPNADRIFFWDDSAGSTAFLTVGSGLQISGTTLSSTDAGGTVTSIDVSGGSTGLTTSGGPITGSGTITLAGTLAVANGGTGATTSTGSGSVVLATAPTLEGTVTLNQTNAFTNTSAAITNTNADKGTLWNFTQSRSGGAPDANFLFGHGGDSSGDVVLRNTTSSNIKFYVADTERVRLYAGGALICSSGVTLGTAVDTYNAANTLDDYEEGTFTPTIVGTTTAGTATYTRAEGVYTKIGNCVNYWIDIIWASGTGTGNLKVSGLPFTSNSTTMLKSSAVLPSDVALTAGYIVVSSIGVSTTDLVINQTPTGGGATIAVPYDAAGQLVLSGSYFV